MTVVVFGATGQVGEHLRRLLPGARLLRRGEADLTDPERVKVALEAAAPSVIVNAAAYTAVDRAEQEPRAAWNVNAASPAAMADSAARLGVPLIHVSTDYVFDGEAGRAYRENDAPRPLSVYGRTKLAGDLAVQTLTERHWILRTSWVFSEHGSNFVKTMLRLGAERDALRVVRDQRGRPSYAGDVAALIAALIARLGEADCPAPGLYHTGGGPETSWFEFATEIFARAADRGIVARVPQLTAITTAEYPTPAARPLYAVLEPNRTFQQALGVQPDWRAGLDTMLAQLPA